MRSSSFLTRIADAGRAAAVAAFIGIASVVGISGVAAGFAVTANASPIAQAGPDTLYGDPYTAASYWQQQRLDDSCVLISVASVVGEITGRLPSEREMVRLAGRTASVVNDGPVYSTTDELWGTPMPDAVVLLDGYGITAGITDFDRQSESGIATGMGPLTRYLASGSKVIVSLNAETIWDLDGDRSNADHAVAVTGVDPANGVVYLNDSAFPEGRGKKVPVATFVQAWSTSGYRMIVTE